MTPINTDPSLMVAAGPPPGETSNTPKGRATADDAAKAEPSKWDDPSVPVGNAPPMPRWPVFAWAAAWTLWIVFLVAMAWA